MNHEAGLISKLITDIDRESIITEVLKEGISEEMFLVFQEEFKFIRNHRKEYGKLPDEKTFLGFYPKFSFIPCNEPIKFYFDELDKSYLYFKMVEVNETLVKLMQDKKPREAIEETVKKIAEIKQNTKLNKDVDVKDSLKERLDSYDERRTMGLISGIPIGWDKLDISSTGFQNGELNFIVARMGSYKTWIMLRWAYGAWCGKKNVLIFSKEMNSKSLYKRLDAIIAKTNYNSVRTMKMNEEELQAFKDSLEKAINGTSAYIKVVDNAGRNGFNINFIQEKIREYKPDIVFIDGVYLLGGKGSAEWEKQASITRELKQVALSENVPIIGTTQANRKGAEDGIQLENMAFSDSYGQDADNVYSLVRLKDELETNKLNKVKFKQIKGRDSEEIEMLVKVDLNKMEIEEEIASELYYGQDEEVEEIVSFEA